MVVVGIGAGGAGAARFLTFAVILGNGLAENRKVLVAAGRDVDASTGGGIAGVEGEAGLVVVILEVRVDPSSGESTGALEGEGGSVEEVVDVQVGELHAEGLADTSSLVVGHGGVDDLEAVQLAWALAHDGVDTDGTDTVAAGRAGNNDGDGVSTGSEVDTSVAVVGRLVGVVRADVMVSVVAVVTADQGRLEDELAVVIDRESIPRTGQISNAEDSRTNRDEVVGLADGGAGSAKVELVPAAIDLKLDGSASMVVLVVVLMAVIVVILVAVIVAALRATFRATLRAALMALGGGRAAGLADGGAGAAAEALLGGARGGAVAGLARTGLGLAADLARAPAGLVAGTRSAARVRAQVRVHLRAGLGELVAGTDIRVAEPLGAAVTLGSISSLDFGLSNAEQGAGENNGVLEGEHHLSTGYVFVDSSPRRGQARLYLLGIMIRRRINKSGRCLFR